MIDKATKLLRKAGVDKAIAYTVSGRMVQAAGSVGILFSIAHYLTKVEQGYYYTFSSIMAIQIFFELGFNTVITQFAAHEMANLHWVNNEEIAGNPVSLSRLAHLLRLCFRSFTLMALALLAVLITTGFVFFLYYHNKNGVNWQGPWLVLSLTTAGFFLVDPLMSFLQGLNKVKDLARYRVYMSVCYIVSVILFLVAGFKLYAPALSSMLSLVCLLGCLFFSPYKSTILKLWKCAGEWKISYRQEIFPFQWKIAVSWISGYFIYTIFNPVLFATEGAVVAGQMGMTLAGFAGVASLAGSWIYTKIPAFSALIAKRQFAELDERFNRTLFQSLSICLAGLITYFVLVHVMQAENFSLGKRFLPLLPFLLLVFIAFINQVNYSLSTYLRCHNKEPLLVQSAVIAALSCISTFIFGRMYGVMGITIGYLTVVTISLPWTIFIFNKRKKEWHAGEELDYGLLDHVPDLPADSMSIIK